MKYMRMRARAGDDRGGVVVEFGLMLPILILLLSGLIMFGVAASIRLTLTQAARDGVRVYALVPGGDWNAAAEAHVTGMDGVVITNSGNCDPSSPGNPPPAAWVNAARDFTFDFAFVPPQTVTLQGRAAMRCGG